MEKITQYILIILFLLFLSGADWRAEIEANKVNTPPSNASTQTTETKNENITKTIYLTMDMDMSEWMYQQHVSGRVNDWYDPNLFAYLLQNKIPVTFFVSGLFAQTYPDLIKELNSTGNYSFQNHSYDESSFTSDCYQLASLSTSSEKVTQIMKTQNILTEMTGHQPTQFRFPGDCHSPADNTLVQNLGLTINNGTIIAGDPFNTATQSIVNNILENVKDNAVILMHIGGHDSPESLSVLEQIVPTLKKEGYSFAIY